MNTSRLIKATIKRAFEARKKGDSRLWLTFFTPDAILYIDGSPENFQGVVKHERFTSIDKAENNDLDFYSALHAKSRGDFKFDINKEGKIYRLDINYGNE
jgi:hypothetical protein